jgi:hypothetical protein
MFGPGSKDLEFESWCSPVCWWRSLGQVVTMLSPGSKDHGFDSRCSPVCWWRSLGQVIRSLAQDQRISAFSPGHNQSLYLDKFTSSARLVYQGWVVCQLSVIHAPKRTLGLIQKVESPQSWTSNSGQSRIHKASMVPNCSDAQCANAEKEEESLSLWGVQWLEAYAKSIQKIQSRPLTTANCHRALVCLKEFQKT